MSPQGELTRWVDRRGATIARRTVGWEIGTGVPTHTAPRPALSSRVPPPTESRLNCWQMTLPPLQMLPQPFPRRAWPMTEVRRLFLYAMAVE